MSDLFYSAKLSSRFPELVMVESRRNGGFSVAPFNSLNLGLNTSDRVEHVQKNRGHFFKALNISEKLVAGGLQVHGSEVLRVEKAGYFEGFDAFITHKKDLFLTIGIADCTPILIYDSLNKVIGAAHAGWRGTVAKIGQKTINAMQSSFGTQAENCYVFIGTCIDQKHFEVGEEVAEYFDKKCIKYYSHTEKPHIDLKEANKQQLIEIGVPENQIETSPFSTVEDNDKYFSYRNEKGVTGRMLAVIGIKTPN
ncbi:MAG: peptidoglycan editing factor PgeF [Chitinophagales bacterium]|nr:peptidoglycan editing factor PgeF [Chitinophagales bacterium]